MTCMFPMRLKECICLSDELTIERLFFDIESAAHAHQWNEMFQQQKECEREKSELFHA